MRKIKSLLRYFDEKKDEAAPHKEKSKFEYISDLFYGLLEIIAIENSIDSNHPKRIMFESFCFNVKKILDQYKELKGSKYFEELKRIRNMLTHEVITYQINDNGITFNSYEKGNVINYSKYYVTNEGTINISNFMSYYTTLLARELFVILNFKIYKNLQFQDKYLKSGIDILSEYEMELDPLHDQYVTFFYPLVPEPEYGINGNNHSNEYEDKCKKALEWVKDKVAIFPVDYLLIHIRLSEQSNNYRESISYAKRAEKALNDIKEDYPFVSTYLKHIYAGISRNSFHFKDKGSCIYYALKSTNLITKAEADRNLLEKIIFYVNLANARSLYCDLEECRILLYCFEMICEVNEGSYKNITQHKLMVFGNLLESFSFHKQKLPEKCISSIISLQKNDASKSLTTSFKLQIVKYYKSVEMFPEAINLIKEMINKKTFKGNEKSNWKLELQDLIDINEINISPHFSDVEKKAKKLKFNSNKEKNVDLTSKLWQVPPISCILRRQKLSTH